MIVSFISTLMLIIGATGVAFGGLGLLAGTNIEFATFIWKNGGWLFAFGYLIRHMFGHDQPANQKPFVLNESSEDNSNEMSQEEWNRAIQEDIKWEGRQEKRERAIEDFREDNGRDPNFFEKWGM